MSLQECTTVSFTHEHSELNSATSTSAAGISSGSKNYYVFESLVVIIGIVGSLANGLVLYVMCTTRQLKKSSINILFVNQMSLDLFSCVWLVISYSVKLADIYLVGTTGYWLCVFVIDENIVYCGLIGSSVNLASIAIERYLKIVHPIWHKNHFRQWMTWLAVVIPWIYGIVANHPVTQATTIVAHGQCLWGAVWISDTAKALYGIWFFVSYFVVVFLSFLYCYGRIIHAVRKQTKVIEVQQASHPQTSAGNIQNLRIQINTIKTMIIVSILFVVSWLPSNVYILLFQLNLNITFRNDVYYSSLFLAFLNVCMNPFIYATKYDLVRKQLVVLRLRLLRVNTVEDSGITIDVPVQSTSHQAIGTEA